MEASWRAIYSRLLMNTSRSFPLILVDSSFPNGTIHQTFDCLMYTERASSEESPVDVQVGDLGTMCPIGHSHRLRKRL